MHLRIRLQTRRAAAVVPIARDRASDAAPGDGGLQPFKGVANSACGDLARLGVTWWYNWTQGPSGCTASEFVPMIWGHTGSEQSASGIATAIGNFVSARLQDRPRLQ